MRRFRCTLRYVCRAGRASPPWRALVLLTLVLGWCQARAEGGRPLPVFRQVAGEIRTVTVERGDTLVAVAARVGIGWETLAAQNHLDNPDRIFPGQTLRVDTRRIVPTTIDEGWVVNVPDATLYVVHGGALDARYSVGLGKAAFPTPIGNFTILFQKHDPTWDTPTTITEEMRREARIVRMKASPGPEQQPLGPYWIQLSTWGYGIHGTPFLGSIGQHLSYGCIRVGSPFIKELVDRAQQGTKVDILYLPVKLAVLRDGSAWLEAHPDVYGLGSPGLEDVTAAFDKEGVLGDVDLELLERVLGAQEGIAQRIGNPPSVRAPEDPEKNVVERTEDVAAWRCLDCPPGLKRRVTFQIEARQPLDLPNPYPIQIRNDAGRIVFEPQMVAQTVVHLDPGQTRNFVWEMRDSSAQALPPGSYTAVVRFTSGGQTERTLSLPLWVGR